MSSRSFLHTLFPLACPATPLCLVAQAAISPRSPPARGFHSPFVLISPPAAHRSHVICSPRRCLPFFTLSAAHCPGPRLQLLTGFNCVCSEHKLHPFTPEPPPPLDKGSRSSANPLHLSRQGFGGRSNKNSNNQPPQGKGNASPTMSHQAAPQQYPPSQGQMYSPSMAPAAPNDSAPIESERAPSPQNRKPPYFFREEHANLIVKGNFMTLAAKPKMVDEGEWLAHQG